MEVILLEKIRNLGSFGALVKVTPGYARNFLIPTGKALYATPDNRKVIEERRAEFEKKEAEAVKAAQVKLEALTALPVITLNAKAGEEGKLFGSITTRDIATAITNAGVEVNKSDILLAAGTIRQVGEYDIQIELHGDLIATIKVQVVPEA